jgi:hypothetical protein
LAFKAALIAAVLLPLGASGAASTGFVSTASGSVVFGFRGMVGLAKVVRK